MSIIYSAKLSTPYIFRQNPLYLFSLFYKNHFFNFSEIASDDSIKIDTAR